MDDNIDYLIFLNLLQISLKRVFYFENYDSL